MRVKPRPLQAFVVFGVLTGPRLKYLQCCSVVRTLRKQRGRPRQALPSSLLAGRGSGAAETASVRAGAAPDLLECSYPRGASSVVSIERILEGAGKCLELQGQFGAFKLNDC